MADNGFTKYEHSWAEALIRTRIPGEARQVLDFIIRRTVGYQDKPAELEMDDFVKATGLISNYVIRSIKKLLQMNLITKKGCGKVATYSFNKVYATWKPLPKRVAQPKRVVNATKKGCKTQPKKVLIPIIKEKEKEILKIKELYLKILVEEPESPFKLPSIRELSPERKRRVANRIEKYGDDEKFWIDYFWKVRRSDFLMGKTGKWHCNFDWLMNKSNMLKVLEGQYENGVKMVGMTRQQEDAHFAEKERQHRERVTEGDSQSIGEISKEMFE